MSNIYDECKEEVKPIAATCNITDGSEIRKMICERIKDKMFKEGQYIADSTNTMGNDVQEAILEGLFGGISRTHRVIQSDFWKIIQKLITKYGEIDCFDVRNEWAVNMCKRMAIAGNDPGTHDILEKYEKEHSY